MLHRFGAKWRVSCAREHKKHVAREEEVGSTAIDGGHVSPRFGV
jgi:hypothetical protein